MKKIAVSELKPGMVFDKPVYIDGNDLLMGAFQPLKAMDHDRLKKWGVQWVYSEGRVLSEQDTQKELEGLASSLLTKKEGPDINELYLSSGTSPQEKDLFNKYQEIVEVIRINFELSQNNKNLDVLSIRNSANTLLTLVQKNARSVFKLILSPHIEGLDFLYYNAVNTAILATLTAANLKYSRLHILNLIIGAFFHDIGMMKIPPEILLKKEKLSDLEMQILKKHPSYGHKTVEGTNSFSSDVTTMVLQHQERLDGSGYPLGLKGVQISEFARIIAICDAYQAMCQSREYREAKSPPVIIRTLLKEGIGKLDANILKIFIYTVGIYPAGVAVKLSNGSIGEVMMQNIKSLAKPVVRVFIDENNNVLEVPKATSLEAAENIDIEKVLNNEERKEILGRLGRK